MKAVPYILLGASLAVLTSWAIGTVLFRRLRISLHATEERLLAFITGAGLLSGLVFLTCVFHGVYKGVFLAIGGAAIAGAARSRAFERKTDRLPPVSRAWKLTFAAAFAAFTLVYFFTALAPEMSPDGTAYHTALPARYYRAHGFEYITTNFYANLSQGMEMLFLFAFAFGKHSAAALVHFAFLVSVPLLMLCYGRRFGYPSAGAAAAILFYAAPVAGIDGSSAYNDAALAAVLFALFYVLRVWDETRDNGLLAVAGVLAGFAFAIKYTGVLAIPYALVHAGVALRRERQPVLRPLAAMAGMAVLLCAPWLVKNWLVVQNPVSPFANRLFPNPCIHVAFEDAYLQYQRQYELTSWRQIPLDITVRGQFLAGFFGPVFLLSPLALLALRNREGRRVLLAALIFALPYAGNIGARFLIPAAPFLSLALAMAVASVPLALFALAAAHAIACWPSVAGLYAEQYAWRPGSMPIKAALRIEPEQDFLTRNFKGYATDRMIDQYVPRGEKVFSFSQLAEAYTTHEVLVSYQSASNEVLRDILLTPVMKDSQPVQRTELHFPARLARKLRIIQTAAAKGEEWSVAELRFVRNGREIPRETHWLLTARPNPWEIQLAFDNTPVTRWRTWQDAQPGMYIETDFGRPVELDTVLVESRTEGQTRVRLETADEGGGGWRRVPALTATRTEAVAAALRRAAAGEWKQRGIHYLVVRPDDAPYRDFEDFAPYWGMTRLAESGDARLYRID